MLQFLTSMLNKKNDLDQSQVPIHPFSLHGGGMRKSAQKSNEPFRDPFGFFPRMENQNVNKQQNSQKSATNQTHQIERRQDLFGFFPIRHLEYGQEKGKEKSLKGTELEADGPSVAEGPSNTIQEWIKVFESAASLIEKYGPMMKNIPSMLSSFKKSK